VGRPGWVVHTGHRQQNATFGKSQQTGREEFDNGRLVDVQHGAVRKDDFDASTGRCDPITGDNRNVDARQFCLAFAFERDRPVDVRDMGRHLGICCCVWRLRVRKPDEQ
jgi:hypothetical protein